MNDHTESLRLLLVDDDDVDRERLVRLLGQTHLHAQTTQAQSGAAALELVQANQYDCVVLDQNLGDMTGSDLLPRLAQAHGGCPVVMVTGAGSENLAVRALRDGAAGYLVKYQLNGESLENAIAHAINSHRLQRELEGSHRRLQERVVEQANALRQRERDLQAVLDHTPSLIGSWDRELRNRFGNKAFQDWVGVDPQQLPGMSFGAVFGQACLWACQPHLDAVLLGTMQTLEVNIESPQGQTRRAQLNLRPDRDEAGVVQGFYSTASDITAIKGEQARVEELAAFIEAIVAHAPVGVGVYREDGTCVTVNEAMANLLGGALDALRPLRLEQIARWGEGGWPQRGGQVLRSGGLLRLDIDVRSCFDRRVRAGCALSRVDRGGMPHLLVMASDITEQQETHDALVKARDSAEKAAQVKSSFLANMSHEIRTPMNAIVGLSRLALEDALPSTARDYLDKVYSSSIALMRILDDVLDYSKIEAGQLRFERDVVNLEDLIARVVDLFAAQSSQKGLELIVRIDPGVPASVMGDGLRLRQVLNNLVGNAVKFTDNGRIEVEVHQMACERAARVRLGFVVRDTGVGMSSEHCSTLFQAFTQGDSSITRRFGGTGLGLAISKRLVEMMEGHIGARSQLGLGSEFSFDVCLEAAVRPTPPPELRGVKGLRVMLIESNLHLAQALLAHLHTWGVRVSWAKDAHHAVEELRGMAANGLHAEVMLLDCMQTPSQLEALLPFVTALKDGAGGVAPLVVGMCSAQQRDRFAANPIPIRPDAVLIHPVLPSALLKVLSLARVEKERGSLDGIKDQASRTGNVRDISRHLSKRVRALHGLRLLVVEDNALNQLVAKQFLEKLGFVVNTADDGLAAVDILRRAPAQTYAGVLMDLHMPVMDGLEATRRIRSLRHCAGLPIIGMTAAAMPEDRAQCFEAGMVDHVAKPIIPEMLAERLLQWIAPPPSAPASDFVVSAPGDLSPYGLPPDAGLMPESLQALNQLGRFDLVGLRVRTLGNDMLVLQLLDIYADAATRLATDLSELLIHENLDGMRRAVHELRGMSENIGDLNVGSLCSMVSALLKNPGMPQALGGLHDAIAQLCVAIGESVQAVRDHVHMPGEPGKFSAAELLGARDDATT